VFTHVLAPACITTDDPRYLSFIPTAPTKAAAAFDLVVSASALYGGSWLEGAGAVHAENEVLRWLADEFGLPASAGGVFVQGGTLGNLSALVAAREAARAPRRHRRRRADPLGGRLQFAGALLDRLGGAGHGRRRHHGAHGCRRGAAR
jgi:glutamate/tyrosine decarboxylase-like PLP-dependent enzyme